MSSEETINISDVSERHYYVLTASEGRYYKLTLNGDSVYTKLCVYNSEGVEEYVSSDNSKSKSMSKDFIFNEGEKYYIYFGAVSSSETGENIDEAIQIDYDASTITLNNFYGKWISFDAYFGNRLDDFTIILKGDNVLVDPKM